jgi:hypothetical protein
MKRKAPESRSGASTGDVKKDLSSEQLAGIGAVAILFNELEFSLECILYRGLNLPGGLWLETVKRISSFDSKVELASLIVAEYQHYASNQFEAKDWAFAEIIKETLTSLKVVKGLRDAIVHARVFDMSTGIGEKISYKGKIDQVLLTAEALNALYAHMDVLRKELTAILGLADLMHCAILMGGQVNYNSSKLPPLPEIPDQISRLSGHQRGRKSLPKLPDFPR